MVTTADLTTGTSMLQEIDVLTPRRISASPFTKGETGGEATVGDRVVVVSDANHLRAYRF